MLAVTAGTNVKETSAITVTNTVATAAGDSSLCGGYTYTYAPLNIGDNFPFSTPKFDIAGD